MTGEAGLNKASLINVLYTWIWIQNRGVEITISISKFTYTDYYWLCSSNSNSEACDRVAVESHGVCVSLVLTYPE